MSSNQLKIIACVTMLIDHVGLMFFPHMTVFRYIGRIAMPLFAFFIAEGMRYTRSKLRYFLNIFILAMLCQSVYIIEELLSGGITSIYLNILFTFAMSILLGFLMLMCKEHLQKQPFYNPFLDVLLLVGASMIAYSLCYIASNAFGLRIDFDYGFAGIILPLFSLVAPSEKWRLPAFSAGLIIFNLLLGSTLSYTWFSLLAIPLLFLYNGKRGSMRMKYAFYLFYPLHLAALYAIQLMIR